MTSSNGDNKNADHWFKEGLRLGRLDDNDASIAAYAKAVEIDRTISWPGSIWGSVTGKP